jgi:hypothetical protein
MEGKSIIKFIQYFAIGVASITGIGYLLYLLFHYTKILMWNNDIGQISCAALFLSLILLLFIKLLNLKK